MRCEMKRCELLTRDLISLAAQYHRHCELKTLTMCCWLSVAMWKIWMNHWWKFTGNTSLLTHFWLINGIPNRGRCLGAICCSHKSEWNGERILSICYWPKHLAIICRRNVNKRDDVMCKIRAKISTYVRSLCSNDRCNGSGNELTNERMNQTQQKEKKIDVI